MQQMIFGLLCVSSLAGCIAEANAVPKGSGPCSNASLQGTYTGTAAGTLPASVVGGDAKTSVPIIMGFVYTFDGKGNMTGYGQPNIGGSASHDSSNPLGMLKATGTYTVDPATCSGTEEIVVTNQGHTTAFHRWFSLSNNNTQQHFVTVDPGFLFQGTLYKR
jgi:hypothetical protein